ncbi:TetR/AcrR family transcriptional regulator [Aurantiacibacter rhizosphaerae]|uniref:TetR/AcrR family transcriptional regulator n=1 Tax=Aurantiacibacter rhizosphaerae TaxID=2691582 RepID=UPI00192421B2|nr:TetR/AcrR family transcriptional regulator [Aurantiacibacter rhizosphaerae]
MEEREAQIAAAGFRVVSRYGIRRASVNDVAEEAGVSRQTVYNVFPNRSALLAGIVRYHYERQWEIIWQECASASDRRERIEIAMRKLVLEPWEDLQAMPHADELELELTTSVRKEMRVIYDDVIESMSAFFEPYEKALSQHRLTPCDLAHMVQASLAGLKLSSLDRERVESFTRSMLACILCVTAMPHGQADPA